MDGTFSVCPEPFFQLFTIHYFFDNDRAIPALYCLLSGKPEFVYVKLFTFIRNLAIGHSISIQCTDLMADFEVAIRNAALAVWPAWTSHGCYFHFTQALFRKMVELGLKIAYLESETSIQVTIRKFMALAYLHTEDIEDAKNDIIKQATPIVEKFPELKNFFAYFDKQWMTNLQIWNISDNPSHRTNNDVEGWHSAFNKRLKNSNGQKLVFWKFVEKIGKDAIETEQTLGNLVHGITVGHHKSPLFVKKQLKIKRQSDLYKSKKITAQEFITGLIN